MLNTLLHLVGRALIAALFVPSGLQALSDIPATAGYFERLAMPAPTLAAWGIGLFEVAFGLLILVGFQTRIAAFILGLFAITAGYIGHFGQGGEDAMMAMMHMQAFMKDVAVAGGLFILAAVGAGPLSIDARLSS